MSKPDHPTRRGVQPLSPAFAPDAPRDPDPDGAASPTPAPPVAAESPGHDAHGFDPAAYRWVPVLRKPRADGWSPEKQRAFIEQLADCGSVSRAAHYVGISTTSAYRLRRSPGAEGFAAAWDAALHEAVGKLVDVAFDRALYGTYENMLDREGQQIGARIRYNDRLLMFLLRAHMPAVYARAHREASYPPDGPRAPVPPPVAAAIAAMEPVEPADPLALIPPDERDAAIACADICGGQLPHWHRDPDMEAAARARRGERDPVDLFDPYVGDTFAQPLDSTGAGPRAKPTRLAR